MTLPFGKATVPTRDGVLPPEMSGVDTTVQLLPSQCSASAMLGVKPVAHTSSEATAAALMAMF